LSKTDNRKKQQVLSGRVVLVWGGGEDIRKGYRMVTVVEKLYTHVCK
jgi:hypothetical protein